MRIPVLILLGMVPAILSAQSQFSLQHLPAAHEAPPAVLGVWGTTRQCAAFQAGEANHPLLYPYHVTDRWIRQGPTHCYLNWQGSREIDGGLETTALAQCGEDNLREYRLRLRQRNERLQIRWSIEQKRPSI